MELGEIEVKEFVINIETPDGKLPPARVTIPNLPMRLADIVPPIQKLCSGVVGLAIKREIVLGSTLSCHKGCGVCCNQLVPLSAPEVFFLYEYLQTLSLDKQNEIRTKFAKIRKVMESAGLIERLKNVDETDEHQTLALEYFRLGMPCPFLVDEACSIHPVRPIACREYNVTSPPELCADPFKNKILRIKIPRNMTTATAKLASEACGAPLMVIPMPLFIEWAEENEHINHLAWSGIWLFEKMLEYATGSNVDGERNES